MPDPSQSTVTNSSTRHVIEALMLIAQSREPLGLHDIAEAMDLPQSTAHRALMTLEESGFAQRREQGAQLVAGPIVHHLIRSMVALFPARRLLSDAMRNLSGGLDATVSLNWRIGWHSLRLLSIEGSHESYQLRRVGEARPLHSGIGPLTILVALPERQVADYIADWGKFGTDRIAAPDAAKLRQAQETFAVQGHIERPPSPYSTLHWLGVPLFDHDRRAVGSIATGFAPAVLADAKRRPKVMEAWSDHIARMQRTLDQAGATIASPYDAMSPGEIQIERNRFMTPPAVGEDQV